ncbi:PBP1A family penicillin-binding protein [candidate division WOR-3 bacterium]|nr:PBP1A family penicillin-binding protein [candidate division WOR-3 bacterium]
MNRNMRPLLAIILLLPQLAAAGLFSDIPSAESIANYRPPASTRILDYRGRVIFDFFQEKRRPVQLESIPSCLREAVVAIEDRRFYSHWGIDLARVPGLALSTVKRGGIKGTSTITQQLARSMFLTPERSISRKVKEMALAVELERRYSKAEILQLYFNQIWFGGSVYGVEAAAEKYFNKTAARLDPVECATLGAMLANPSAYSPYNHPDRLLTRRNFFLTRMFRLGCISSSELDQGLRRPLNVLPPGQGGNIAPYFVEKVRRYMMEKYGADFVYRSGAVIYTTLDLDMQQAANLALHSHLHQVEKDYRLRPTLAAYDSAAKSDSTIGPPRYLQGALLAMDVQTGYIRALIGGRDYRHSEFNRATQARRQAGSAFKPFIYTAAIDNGMTAADIELDSALTIEIPGQPDYQPHNYDHTFLGHITMRRALALSRNLVAVRLISQIGPQLAAHYANVMGVTNTLQPVYSLALGSVEVTLLDMVGAYNTLADNGIRVKPIMVTRVEDAHGAVLEENRPEQQPVLRPQTAYVLTSLMQSVVNEGTAYAIRQLGYEGPAAGKTGTTDDYADAWFIGFTPDITCGVWVGFDKKKTIFRGATGGSVAAPIWADFMKTVHPESLPSDSFPVPDSIVTAAVCEQTGQMATFSCPLVRYEVFIAGTEPTTPCSLHSRYSPQAPPVPYRRP